VAGSLLESKVRGEYMRKIKYYGITLVLLLFMLLAATVSTALPPPLVDDSGTKARSSSLSLEGLGLQVEVFASELDTPWEITWGPDGNLWFTERRGYLKKIDGQTKSVTTVASIDTVEYGESGLMGLAFHPNFDSQPYIYLTYSYSHGRSIKNRLSRYRYDGDSLVEEEVLIDNLPGNTYHDGSRIAFGSDGYLYMTTGDAGRKSLSRNKGSLAGKILRVDERGNPAPGNPFNDEIYSYGHRNPQGLDFHPETGTPYITEHGPRDNDEFGPVYRGGDYGWPEIHGFCDGDMPGEEQACRTNTIVEPLAAWTPTIAPAGGVFYDGSLIPQWKGSFLFTTLKDEALIRLVLSPAEDQDRYTGKSRAQSLAVTKQEVFLEGLFGRLRDVTVGPDGAVYIATSNRDGRGSPKREDDRILIIRPKK
jgi:glucose/arabinose dehydrogenase